MSTSWIIYRHVHTESGKCYVGMTSKTMERRWGQHVRAARYGSPLLFHKVITKHGEAAFAHEVIESGIVSLSAANAAESRWIAHFGSVDPARGYNLDAGGTAHNSEPESRAKISKAQRAHWASMPPGERMARACHASAAMTSQQRRKLAHAAWDALPQEAKDANTMRLQSSRSSEDRSAGMTAWMASRTHAQRSEAQRQRAAARTPEHRSAASQKRAMSLGPNGLRRVGSKIAATWAAKSPDEQK